MAVLPEIHFGLLAKDIYVNSSGSDAGDGSKRAPLATLQEAIRRIAQLAGSEPITVRVSDGVYYFPEPLVLTPEHSGTASSPVVFQANSSRVVLSGGHRLDLTWDHKSDGIYVAKTPSGLAVDQLFVNGERQRMARYPNYDATKKTEAYQGFAADAFSADRATRWMNPKGGYIHAMHRSRWGGYHYLITGKNDQGKITYEGGWQNNRPSSMHEDYRMVENIFEELDAPGEWYHDAEEDKLYFMPGDEDELSEAVIEIVRLPHLVEFRGSENEPVRHIAFRGFTVRHSARTFMQTKEPMLRSDWTIYRGGAFFLTGTENIQISDCEFDQVGGNAIFASNYNRRAVVTRCHIHDMGASGVCFVGDSEAVRNPLFAYGQKNDLDSIDQTPGPKTNNYPADCVVEDCLIYGVGRVERQTAGVQIEMSSRIQVKNCSIYDCSRAGINIGDGAWGGHLITGCDVFDTVQETHDHGSFNSWGRDRYWRSDQKTTQAAVDNTPELPFLDAMQTTVIHDNRFRCDHGWDIDLDDGSSNYDIYNNLCLAGGLKLREGFRRRAWNNITVNNGLHPHVWYNDSGDEVWSNIFMQAPRPARMPTQQAKGKRVDSNLYYATNPQIKEQYLAYGWDTQSIVADPLFVDPANGDFRVQPNSPAFQVGFENFPMDQFGVNDPELKKLARTPVIPKIEVRETLNPPRSDSPKPSISFSTYWLGAKVDSLKDEEFSAFGVRKEDGGIKVSTVPKSSPAASIGLEPSDLIQKVDDHQVKDVSDLLQAYLNVGNEISTISVIRDQSVLVIELNKVPYVVYETVEEPTAFGRLKPKSQQDILVKSNSPTKNAPIRTLVDGELADSYGPVFPNGNRSGIYRIDLGSERDVHAISTWSTNKNGTRGPQFFTIYGCNADSDPGWKLSDLRKFTPLATIDTTSLPSKQYTATSLRSPELNSLGKYRWIYWHVQPINSRQENSSIQELLVD